MSKSAVIIATILFCLLPLAEAFGAAANCRIASETCTSTDSSGNCTRYHYTYNCGGPGYSDYCVGLENDGSCQLEGQNCKSFGGDGACDDYYSVYKCGDDHGGDGNVTLIDTSYTITKDALVDGCSSQESNANCSYTGQTCTQGAEKRNINGYDVYKDCWSYTRDYACPNPNVYNNCSSYDNASGCTKAEDVCTETYSDGVCKTYTSKYNCPAPVAGQGTLISTTYTEISDTQVPDCAIEQSNQTCQWSNDQCTSGPGTRNINGLDVYRDCWEWNRTYTCANPNQYNNCNAYTDAGCKQTGTTTCNKFAVDGSCAEWLYDYQCYGVVAGGGSQINTVYSVTKDTIIDNCVPYEGNPTCKQMQDACVEGAATKTINGYSVYKDCWAWQEMYTCEGPVKSDCGTVASNCVKTGSKCVSVDALGHCTDTEYSYSCGMNGYDGANPPDVRCGDTVFCLNGDCGTVTRTPNTEFAKGLTWMSLLGNFAKNFDPNTQTVFTGTKADCRKALTGVLDCCKDDSGWSVDIGLGSCSDDEKALWAALDGHLSHYVGTYCNTSFLGVCLEKKKSYCDFQSRLGRIIQEQGRAQLNISWGPADSPNCAGLTIAQLQAIDWSKIDLSEFYPQIYAQTVLPNTVNVQKTMQQSITNFYGDPANAGK
ncbi:conjugal transfer protein TraN [Nitrospirillum amazonense]|uniref:conjugal transfer protein TraN n=1 Tax=Nitrospirillum amazonense TaxID=28077 RepID=UPI0024129085|nr:conjugal transfer protein TraN [Nitrospirillum amazonense]MDG3444545.1 conjugal transfer protein TraN [Nitrospirillum amazonense]